MEAGICWDSCLAEEFCQIVERVGTRGAGAFFGTASTVLGAFAVAGAARLAGAFEISEIDVDTFCLEGC